MKLIFVYNSSLNPRSLIKDFLSEVMPQREANCKLCDITFSLVYKKRAWKEYISSLGIDTEFYLKDRFQKKFKVASDEQYPAIFIYHSNDHSLEKIISAEEINATNELEELIQLIDAKIIDIKNHTTGHF